MKNIILALTLGLIASSAIAARLLRPQTLPAPKQNQLSGEHYVRGNGYLEISGPGFDTVRMTCDTARRCRLAWLLSIEDLSAE